VRFFERLNQKVTAAPLITEVERIKAIDGGRPAEKISVNIASKIKTISIKDEIAPQRTTNQSRLELDVSTPGMVCCWPETPARALRVSHSGILAS